MSQEYVAVPASPAEQQDPWINPSGGDLGWVVVRARDEQLAAFPVTYMDEQAARTLAAIMNGRAR